MEIPRERGSQKPNFLKKSMALEWNFQRRAGVQAKKPSGRGMDILWSNTIFSNEADVEQYTYIPQNF